MKVTCMLKRKRSPSGRGFNHAPLRRYEKRSHKDFTCAIHGDIVCCIVSSFPRMKISVITYLQKFLKSKFEFLIKSNQ